MEDYAKSHGKTIKTIDTGESHFNGKTQKEYLVENTYQENEDGNYNGHYKTLQLYTVTFSDGSQIVLHYYITYANGWTSTTTKIDGTNSAEEIKTTQVSSAKTLQPTIAKWYKTFRNIAIVALLSILVYVGIRITLSSISSDKAKYKQMLMDWIVALCLVFLLHYIMAFSVTINEKIIKAISAISGSSAEDKIKEVEKAKNNLLDATTAGKDSTDSTTSEVGSGVELFIIKKTGDSDDTVKRAYKTLVGDDSDIDKNKNNGYASKKDSYFYNRFVFGDGEDKDPTALIWPANDYMTQARIKGQQRSVDNEGKEKKDDSQMAVTRAGYNVIYVVLVIYTIIFCFTYLKRVIYMAFLTIIAPLVAITYPIDKMNDGKAQAFDMWFKEYLFNLLIQPMHLILYTVLIGSAMDFASQNIFYVVVALGFFMPAEKLLRSFFGFGKAQTPPMFGGPAMSAVMMSGINKLMHKPPKGGLGPGSKGGESEGEDEEGKLPFMNKSIGSAEDLFGSAKGDNEKNLIGSNTGDGAKNNILGDKLSKNNLGGYDSRLSKSQIDELKAEGIGPGDQEYDMYLRNMGLNKNNSKNNNNSNLKPVNKNVNTPKFNKTPITSGATARTNATPKKRSLKRAVRAGLINKGDKYKRKYFGKNWRNLTKAQAAAMVGKKAAGLGAKAALAYAGATAAGIASITGGDMQKGASNMIAAGVGGYALGKGISNKINSIDHKSDIDAMREAYYGDEYKAVQQKKAEEKFAKDEKNIKRIEQKLKVDREKAKEIAEEMAKYTDKEGINDVDTTLAIYQMQQEGWDLEDARYAASYNNVAFDGKNTNYMKEKDREDYKNSFKSKLMSRDGVEEKDANVKANNLFRAMDRFNELKS